MIRATRKYVRNPLPPADLCLAIVDPVVNALTAALGVPRRHLPPGVLRERDQVVERALVGGTAAIAPGERSMLLADPLALSRLHLAVWSDERADAAWHEAREHALRFRRHNLELFEKMHPHYRDRAKLIAVVKQGRRQLEEQMARERAERDERKKLEGDRAPGWSQD